MLRGMSDIKVGDEVRVFTPRTPKGGCPAEVVKVGRKLVTVTRERPANPSRFSTASAVEEVFRIDTGGLNVAEVGMGTYFRTLAQVALDDRRSAAEGVLREHKVRLDFGHSLTLEQIEALAAVFDGQQT